MNRRIGRWLVAVGLLGLAVHLTGLLQADERQADDPQPSFKAPDGFVVEQVAGPPLVEYPMHACFDDRGRLYVADSLGINPRGEQLSQKPTMVIRLLDDTDGDGQFDRSSIFADQLVFPQGVLWHDGVVYTASPPSLWRLEDTDGDGQADQRQELVTGFPNTGIADDLHGPTVGPDGRIYWTCGRFAHQIRRPGGEVLWRGRAPLVLRCQPDGGGLEVYGGAQPNAVKVVFTPEGEPFACGTWSKGEGGRQDVVIHCVEGGNYPNLDGDFYSPQFPHTPDLLPPLASFGPASASGVCRYRSQVFGADYQHNLFAALFNMHKVVRLIVERDGATFQARTEDFLVSTNKDFRPADVLEDADGSLLIINTGTWSNCCEAFRAGGQPKATGGIWRVRREAVPRERPGVGRDDQDSPDGLRRTASSAVVDDPRGLKVDWNRLSDGELIRRLDDPRFAVRDRAVSSLARRPGALAEIEQSALVDPSERVRRNAIWALTRRDDPQARAAVRRMLSDPAPSVRLTACASAGLHKDSEAAASLRALLMDDNRAIRREAATALGRLRDADAVPPLFDALRAGGDQFLEHALIHALIRIGDHEATLAGLRDPSPLVRRGALIALDQMQQGQLTQDLVTPLLNTEDAALQKTVLAVIAARPGWAREIIGLLRRWLAEREVPADRQESLRGVLLAFSKDADVQQVVAQSLRQEETPPATRLLLLETIARAPLDQLPDAWIEALGRHLQHADPRVLRQTIATIQAGRVSQFDAALLALARDQARPGELRVAALSAAATRMNRIEPTLFDFLLARLEQDAPLARLEAAVCLGLLRLDDAQLETLAGRLKAAGSLETPHLIAAFERSQNPVVGRRLLAALEQSPGLTSVAPDSLRRLLDGYPDAVRAAAAPLFRKLAMDDDTIQARIAELTPIVQDGSSQRGREVFFGNKAACSACHAVRNEGGQFGPNLTQIGGIRSERDLLVAIAFPSAGFARGYEPMLVTTRSGRVLSGILRRETADAIYLATPDRAELRIPRDDIEELEPGKASIMPQGLDQQLNRQELADLMAFLRSLK
jgi:putative membrane-bound dehydrogenase-like protein